MKVKRIFLLMSVIVVMVFAITMTIGGQNAEAADKVFFTTGRLTSEMVIKTVMEQTHPLSRLILAGIGIAYPPLPVMRSRFAMAISTVTLT